jgi:hypothetical protein
VPRKQDTGALRQHTRKGVCATPQEPRIDCRQLENVFHRIAVGQSEPDVAEAVRSRRDQLFRDQRLVELLAAERLARLKGCGCPSRRRRASRSSRSRPSLRSATGWTRSAMTYLKDAGLLRTDHRLRVREDPQMGPSRNSPGRIRRSARNEVGRRSDGDRVHVQGSEKCAFSENMT